MGCVVHYMYISLYEASLESDVNLRDYAFSLLSPVFHCIMRQSLKSMHPRMNPAIASFKRNSHFILTDIIQVHLKENKRMSHIVQKKKKGLVSKRVAQTQVIETTGKLLLNAFRGKVAWIGIRCRWFQTCRVPRTRKEKLYRPRPK